MPRFCWAAGERIHTSTFAGMAACFRADSATCNDIASPAIARPERRTPKEAELPHAGAYDDEGPVNELGRSDDHVGAGAKTSWQAGSEL